MRTFFLVLAATAGLAGATSAATLIDGTTPGLYNAGIGQSLDGTNPFGGNFMFPLANVSGGDPSLDIPAGSPPDLSAAAAALGSWLTTPASPGGAWSGAPVAIPAGWAINSETAIIYAIDAGATGLINVNASFGVDNGLFAWIDGTFLGGHLRPGGVSLGEFQTAIGSLSPGLHYLQILREDHGGATGYQVSVTGDPGRAEVIPLPAALPLLSAGLALFFALGRRRA